MGNIQGLKHKPPGNISAVNPIVGVLTDCNRAKLLFLQRPLRGHKPNTGRLYEAFLSILQGVTLEKEMSTLRFRMGMAEAENASLRGKIRTIEAIETVTRSQERRTRREMKRQLASVQ
ncbi:hypothetical protein Tco_0546384 [Tanacetum coccineum]